MPLPLLLALACTTIAMPPMTLRATNTATQTAMNTAAVLV